MNAGKNSTIYPDEYIHSLRSETTTRQKGELIRKLLQTGSQVYKTI